MTEDKKAGEAVEFPLNKELLEESAKIKEERGTIKERLEKIEGSKADVSESVYQKVKSDYTAQLDENSDKLLEKKQGIDRELATLYEAKKKVEENVNAHKESLEEINFRHKLGEFKGAEFNKTADEENEKLGKFQKILTAIESNIKQYEEIFEGEENLGGETEAPIQDSAPPPPPPSTINLDALTDAELDAPINVEEEYHIETEDGYFGQVTEDVEVPPDTQNDMTNKAIDATPLETTESTAKLTIVEGEGKGEEYVIVEDEITIGRASSNQIVLKEAKVSRQHVSVKKQGNEYLIADLHSSNGVFVNDEKVKEHALAEGDLVRIGDFILRFSQ